MSSAPANESSGKAGLAFGLGGTTISPDDIKAAAATLRGSIIVTDCSRSRTLSEICGCNLWLKFENLQFTSTFKERGALNRLSALSVDERCRGVIAMSAGNHAQGVAYHAKRLGIPATIVMPVGTPMVKIENTRRHGAEVIISGQTLEEAGRFVQEYAGAQGLTLIHPYDDPLVIAGQGTIALEMLEAVPQLQTLIVPIGGGGLISGMAIAAKAINPDIRIVGVQARLYPSMYNVVKGEDLPIRGDTLAEGIAVKAPGQITRNIIRRLVDDIVLVSDDQIERAVAMLISVEKTVAEGAGAAGLAAVLAVPERFQGENVGLILTGGNIDTRLATLREDFETLQADLKGLYGDVSAIASERAALAMRQAEEVADRAMLLAEEAAREAKVKATEYSEEAQEWAEDNAEELRAHVRAQPLASLLIAGGIGAFLGAIFLRRS